MLRFGLKAAAILAYRLTTLGLRKGAHVTRYFMYRHLAQFSQPRDPAHRVLSISHSEDLARRLGFADHQITEASYPDYNILDLPFADGEFDAVFSDQVLEHVEGDPGEAIRETFRVLKPGGVSLHTTCFINPIHGCPHDFWRFTPDGLRLYAGRHGRVLDAGGWGNPLVWIFAALGLRYQQIPHARLHPAHWLATLNTPAWPIVTWVLTEKTPAAERTSTS